MRVFRPGMQVFARISARYQHLEIEKSNGQADTFFFLGVWVARSLFTELRGAAQRKGIMEELVHKEQVIEGR